MTTKNNNKIKRDNKKQKPEPVGQVKDVTKTVRGIFELDKRNLIIKFLKFFPCFMFKNTRVSYSNVLDFSNGSFTFLALFRRFLR